jgi:cell pole-organizing protein PopZ
MSAANASVPSQSPQEEMRAHEPSMEEILASIRRIIADDQLASISRRDRDARRRPDADAPSETPPSPAQKAYPAPALDLPPPSGDAAPVEAVSETADSAQAAAPVVEIRRLRLHRAAPPPPATEEVEEIEEVGAEVGEDAEAAEADAPDDTLRLATGESDEISVDDATTDASVDETLVSADTASSVASHFRALAESMFLNDSGLLQQYAQEMMRPMLREWLDDNLPVIVERLVRAEIERVARGGRR